MIACTRWYINVTKRCMIHKRIRIEVFEKLGLTLTSGIKIYLQAVIREQAIPFRIEAASSRNADERMM